MKDNQTIDTTNWYRQQLEIDLKHFKTSFIRDLICTALLWIAYIVFRNRILLIGETFRGLIIAIIAFMTIETVAVFLRYLTHRRLGKKHREKEEIKRIEASKESQEHEPE